MRRIALLCPIIFLMAISSAFGQISIGEKSKIKGLAFGDFYWIPQNHDSDLEGENGFWFRRIYLTFETKISDSFSSRLRLEMNSEGDFVTNSSMIPDVKDAYLKWKKGDHAIYAGISGTPTWGLVEDVWGYRSVEKTPLDLQRLASSRDFGLAAKGKLGSNNKWSYHLMVGNGNSSRNEINQGKKVLGSLGYKLTENIIVEGYADYNSLPNNRDIYTAQFFGAYQSDGFTLGLQYAHQVRKNNQPGQDLNLNIASVFTTFGLSENVNGFFRIDHTFDANPRAGGIDYIPFSDQAESTFLLGGVDVALDPNVHLMPNVEAVVYGEDALGNTPKSDIIPRMTLMFKF